MPDPGPVPALVTASVRRVPALSRTITDPDVKVADPAARWTAKMPLLGMGVGAAGVTDKLLLFVNAV